MPLFHPNHVVRGIVAAKYFLFWCVRCRLDEIHLAEAQGEKAERLLDYALESIWLSMCPNKPVSYWNNRQFLYPKEYIFPDKIKKQTLFPRKSMLMWIFYQVSYVFWLFVRKMEIPFNENPVINETKNSWGIIFQEYWYVYYSSTST